MFGAIALFVWQVTTRSSDYFKYATTMDLNIIPARKLEFPDVTICNLNNFRLVIYS